MPSSKRTATAADPAGTMHTEPVAAPAPTPATAQPVAAANSSNNTNKPVVNNPATDIPEPTPAPAESVLPPFVVVRQPTYQMGSAPTSGHYNLDFETDAGRQHVRDLAHDLLLHALEREAAVTEETVKRRDRIVSILMTTTDSTQEEALAQADALLAAGIEFKR